MRAVDAGELTSRQSTEAGTLPIINHELWSCIGNGPGAAPKVAGASEVVVGLYARFVSRAARSASRFEILMRGMEAMCL